MHSTRRAPGKTSKNKANHSIGKFLSMPWWAGIGAIAAVLAISGAVAAVLAILPSDQNATQGAPHSSTQPTSTITPFGSMTVGTCVNLGPAGSGGEIVINCGYPHDAELDDIQKATSN